ncbi:hypothetical protein [Enhygromyxa salina]|uniref:Uncharacterized protein n=1 Tax=Enhygromyxa salina TaxID=215803 RepID=A0A2S9Y486_9BACT|nr:hypothetical protein [Enhygromyxa salina]PRP99904.1 hypothetical protein ENSA7_61210 [Enhygromyxa salina]
MNPAIFAGLIVAVLAATGSGKHKPNAAVASGGVAAWLVWFILGPVFMLEIGLLIEAITTGDWGSALVALGFTLATAIVLFPWPIARGLLIPGGRVKLAWAVTRLSFWVWRRDVRGGALVAASWALTRRAQRGGRVSPQLLAWIERRMAATPVGEVRWRLGGAGIVAAGLLAEGRGDRDQARQLLSSAGELSEPTWPRHAIALAWTWLCAEAVERGAWREVEFLARTAPIEASATKFLGAVAARLTGIAPLPSNLELRWRWLVAPRRIATAELLRRALATPASPRASQARAKVSTPTLPSDEPLLAAMTLHAHTLTRDPNGLTRDDLGQLARAWDIALADPELPRRLLDRAAVLGAHAGEQHTDQLAELVRDDLLALVRAANLQLGQLGDDSELLGRAARRLHGELLDALEVATGALEGRIQAKRELPTLDEWQSFVNLREQYMEAVAFGGLPMRRLAFGSVHGPVCSLAVWLWNDRSERAIGNAIFNWLLAEAVIVDDAEAIRLQERNVDCGV